MIELCFNLWYCLDREQNIVAISAKAYMLDGTEDEKAALLKQLSRQDYRTVVAAPAPANLRRRYPI